MSKPLRIAVWHNLPSGGAKRALYNQIKGLLGRGHYIESWCPDIADQKHISLKGLVEEHVVPLDLGNLSSKSVVYDLMKDYESVKILIEAFDKHFRQVANDIEGRDFDVLFVNSCVCFRTSAIAQYVNLPSLIYLGEPYRWYYEALPELPWLYPRDGEEGIRQDLLGMRKIF
jgi:hypothetical protein